MRTVFCALALSVVAVGLVHAQGGVNGSIEGSVFDQTGAPIKGVKITVTSPTQIGGAKSTYTNDEGYFRLIGLLPGTFDVIAMAPKLRTVNQKNVKVGVDAPASVDVVMEVETQVEEVKIIEKAPVVSTTSPTVKEVYDEEFVDNLPLENRFAVESFIGLNTPGAYSTDGNRGLRLRGGSTTQNSMNVEGFRVNGMKVTVKSLAALEVLTAGYGAENSATPGGVVNMVSKSGSNKYELDVSGQVQDSNLAFFKDASDAENHSWNYMINPAFSGPLVKDRVWFYLNSEFRTEASAREKDLSGLNVLPTPPGHWFLSSRGSLKLTWQISARHKLSSFSSWNRDESRWNGSATRDEADAFSRKDEQDMFHGFIWEALLTDSLFLRSQVGYGQTWDETKPERCTDDPIDCDNIPQIRNTFPKTIYLQNFDSHTQVIDRTIEVVNQLEYFAHTKIYGEHHLKAKSRFYNQLWESAESTPGDSYIQFRGTDPELRREYFSNDPRLEPARYGWRIRSTSGLTTQHSLSDSIRMTRYLTVSPGMAYTYSFAANEGRATNLSSGGVTPHLSVAWDATHDGRTVVRGSFNQYLDTDAMRLARFELGDRVYRQCRWVESNNTGPYDPKGYTSGCTYGGGASTRTFGLPCGPNGVNLDGTSCRNKLKIPRTWEYTAGLEREIVQGVAFGSDLIYRLYTFPYETYETNRIWDESGYTLERLGGYRNGRSETVNDLETPSSGRKRYLAVTTSLRKREGAFKANVAYTWAAMEGNFSNNEGDFGTNPARDRYYIYGYLPEDSRHQVRAQMTYQLRRWVSFGWTYRYTSGRPFQRKFRNDVESGFVDYRAQVGINPGGNINDPDDDRPLRLPDLMEMNLQARFNLKPVTGINLDAFVDVLNMLALRTTTSVTTDNGPTWSRPGSRMGPMRMRIGFRYRY